MADMTKNDTAHNFPLDGPINLFVRIGHGSVRVQTRDDLAEASVRITHRRDAADAGDGTDRPADPPVAALMQGRTLHVAAPREGGLLDLFGRGPRNAVDVHVVVPTRTAVKITTNDAPITIDGRVSGADLAFGRGGAEIGEIDGDLRLRFGQGRVTATRVGGGVQVRSGAGAVSLGEVDGDLRSGCGSGGLDVQVVRGAVQVRSGSGTTRLGAVYGDVEITSGSGSMEIGLPSGIPARVDAHTGSGQVRTELTVEEERAAPASGEKSISVRARTGHGDIRFVRAA